MEVISRRDFLAHSTAAIGAATSIGLGVAKPATLLRSAADKVSLGKTGITTSLLGLGTGTVGVRRSSNQVRLGQAEFTRLVRHAVDRGITYFDTADQYGSHIFLREALRGVPRDQLFIQTKTRATTASQAEADVERFREELGVDYIDSLLMHCMTRESFPTDFRPVMDVLSKAKDKGYVRAIGVSCHGMEPLRASVECNWIEVQLARINPVGVEARMDGAPDQVVPCLKKMHEKGRGVLGMKILGEGTFKSVEQRIASLRFVLGLGCVDAFVIGFERPGQVDQVMDQIASVLAT
jgi:aryl-alcohol dehydrogenase-like predicted oxidoreductase